MSEYDIPPNFHDSSMEYGTEPTLGQFSPVRASKSGAADHSAVGRIRVRPCQPCRLRKSKCVRTEGVGEGLQCSQCSSKGSVCTPMPPRKKSKAMNRGGRLIDTAQAQFGKSVVEDLPPALSFLRPSSAAAQLSSSEIQDYLESSQTNPSFFEEINLRSRFDAAGRRGHQLDNQCQVLLAAVAALASRYSDHCLIVGNCPYRLSDLHQASIDGVDLSEYGQRRQAACSALTDHAVRLADEKHTLRTTSLESMSSLMLLEELLLTWDFAASPRLPWTASYLAQARGILEGLPFMQPMNPPIVTWTAIFRDGILSSKMGCPSSITDDDLFLMWGGQAHLPIKYILSVPEKSHQQFRNLFNSFIQVLAQTALSFPRRLTGAVARVEPLDEYFVMETLTTLDDGRAAVAELTRRILYRKSQKMPRDTQTHYTDKNIRSLRLMRCSLCFILHSALGDDDGYRALRQETSTKAFETAREVSNVLGDLLKDGRVACGDWADTVALEVLFGDITKWVTLLLDHPTVEEGGPHLLFTSDAKLTDLDAILKCIRSMSWTFEKVGQSASCLEGELAKQRAKRDEFWTLLSQSSGGDQSS